MLKTILLQEKKRKQNKDLERLSNYLVSCWLHAGTGQPQAKILLGENADPFLYKTNNNEP